MRLKCKVARRYDALTVQSRISCRLSRLYDCEGRDCSVTCLYWTDYLLLGDMTEALTTILCDTLGIETVTPFPCDALVIKVSLLCDTYRVLQVLSKCFGETLRVSECNSQTEVSDAAFCRVTVLWRCNRLSLTLTLKQSTDQSVRIKEPKHGQKCIDLDYMTVVWYDGDTFFSLSVWCIGDWASERYCDHMVCLCVCLSV